MKNYARVILSVAALCVCPHPTAAQTWGRPGDSGTITFPLANDATSGIAATNVQISTNVVPADLTGDFQVTSITSGADGQETQSGTIPVGFTQAFVVNYTISSTAQDGDHFQVFLEASFPNQVVLPDPGAWNTNVSVAVDAEPPVVSVADVDDNGIPNNGTTQSPIVTITAQDTESGLAEIDFPGFEPFLLNGSTVSESVEFDAVTTGVNLVQVRDVAGNVATFTFTEGNASPVVSFASQDGTIAIEFAAGNSAPMVSDIAPSTYNVTLVDPTQTGLLNVQVTGSATGSVTPICIPSLPFATGANAPILATCLLYAAQPDNYTFTVNNASGTTTINWTAALLNVIVSSSTAATLNGSEFHTDLQLTVNSNLGLQEIQSYEISNSSAIDTRTTTDFGNLPDMTTFSTTPYQRNYYVTDTQGNQQALTTTLGVGAYEGTINGGGYAASFGTTEVLSDPIQISSGFSAASGLLAAAAVGGVWTDSRSGQPLNGSYACPPGGPCAYVSTTVFQSGTGGVPFGPNEHIPLTNSTPCGTVNLYVQTGNSPAASDAEQQIGQGSITLETDTSDDGGTFTVISTLITSNIVIPLEQYARLKFAFDAPTQSSVLPAACSESNADGTCASGAYCTPAAYAQIPVALLFITTGPAVNSAYTTLLAGSAQNFSVGAVQIANANVVQQGTVQIAYAPTSPPLGWTDINALSGTNIMFSTPTIISGPYSVTVPYSSRGTSASNTQNIRVVFTPTNGSNAPAGPSQILPVSVNSGHTVTATVTGPGIVEVVASQYSNPVTTSLNGLTFTSNSPGPTLANAGTDARTPQLLNVLANQGLAPVGNSVIAGPSGMSFSPPATVTYTPTGSASQFTQVSLASAQSTSLASLQYNAQTNTYSGYVSQLHSLFGAFTNIAPVPLADLLPPQTSLVVGTTTVAGSTQTAAYVGESIGFSALDPPYANAPVSGVAHTYYLLDTPFLSTATSPGSVFVSSLTFTLTSGSHLLSYYSVDNAGNYEPVNVTTITVTLSPTAAQGGRGLGIDSSGSVWNIAFDNSGDVGLSRSNQNGVFIGSATLPGADPGLLWSVLFDASGNPYAIGGAIGPNGADQLAVYEGSPSGAIVSSQTFDSGFNNNNLVFATTNSGWIVGTVQTSGPISLTQNGNRTYQLAIWKFNPATGLIQLTTTTYSRAGFDAAAGIAVDGSGNLWISGFSESPNPVTANVFDLALWEFAPDGRTLLQGPIYRTNATANVNMDVVTPVILSSGTAFVAYPRLRPSGQTTTNLAAFSMSSGTLTAENGWQASDGSSAFPSAIVQDSSGNIVSVGGYNYSDATSAAGIWRYGPGGLFASAALTNAGGARGAAFSDGNLWLSVDGSTSPYLDNGETAAAGSLSDVEPPRTSVAATAPSGMGAVLYAGIGSDFFLNVVDDVYNVGDGLGTGPVQTFLSIDASSFTVYTSSFSLAEGSHTLQFYNIDSSNNAEVVESTTVASDDTPPITTLQVLGSTTTDPAGTILVSSSTIFALNAVDPVSNGVASGVSATYYVIDQNPFSPACEAVPLDPTQPNGTCANEVYDSSFTLAVGTHTIYYLSEDVAENQETVNVASLTVVAMLNDNLPPRTSLVIGPPSFSSGTLTYITSTSTLGLVAADDAQVVGDGLGVGVAATYVSLNGRSFNLYSGGTTTIPTEGIDTISYYSVDLLGHAESVKTSTVVVDNTPPTTALAVLGSSSTASGILTVSTATQFSLSAFDSVSNGVASGVAQIEYFVDVSTASCQSVAYNGSASPGTCANPDYTAPFTLANGEHMLTYGAVDEVGNAAYVSTLVVVGVPGAYEPVVAVSSALPSSAVALGTATVSVTGSAFASGALSALLRLNESNSTWSAGAAMTHARQYGTLTLMSDGTVLTAGGIDASGNPSASSELWDPTLQIWLPLTPMNVARASFTATLLADGRLLAIGGSGAGGVALASAETYSPATGQWSLTGSMANARGGGQKSIQLQSGLVLVAGGRNPSAIAATEIYAPSSGLWSSAGSLHTARANAPLVLLPSGQVLIAGGTTGSSTLASAEIYTPSSNSWAVTGSLTNARKDATAVLLDGGAQVLIAGGSASSALSSSELYAVSSGTWSVGPNLNAARTLHALAFTGEGVPIVLGGQNSSGELSSVEYYSNNAWTTTSPLPQTFDYGRAVVLDNGGILAAGGQNSGQPTAASALYAPNLKGVAVASSAVVVSTAQLTAALPLTNVATGYWAVGVRNANQQLGLLPGGFQVTPAPTDVLPPRTTLQIGPPSYSSATLTYITSVSTLGLVAVDDRLTIGDDLGVGVATTYVSLNGAPFNVYSGGTTTIPTEGLYAISYYSVDLVGNTEAVHTSTVAVDDTPPITTLTVLGSSTTNAYGDIDISAATPIILSAIDPISNGVASGVAATYYVIDQDPFSPACEGTPLNPNAPNGTCTNELYDGAFTLTVGTHTVYYFSEDTVGNQENENISSFSVVAVSSSLYTFNPSSGPIGVPFNLTGPGGFGTYEGLPTKVLIGGTTAPVYTWGDTAITGAIPGLATGTYTVQLSTPGSGGLLFAGNFTVTALSSATLSVSSGPIGTSFTFNGSGFGPYANTLTSVLIGGATAPIAVWNDAVISGRVPSVSSGTQPVVVQRAASNGLLEDSATFFFSVVVPTITAISPSSGPVGVSYTLTGNSFGAYDGALTQVLIGGTTSFISVWNNNTITGTIPGGLVPSTYPVVVEIGATNGGLVLSNTAYFQIVGLDLATVSPSSGPVGTSFTLTGSGFGAYGGTSSQVLIDGTTAFIAVWNNSTITGTLPAVSSGSQPLWVERISGTGLQTSNTVYFQVVTPNLASISPSSGAIGVPFTLTGSGFGAYAGANTQVLVGGTTAFIAVWNDTTIQGDIPAVTTGTYGVAVERLGSGGTRVLTSTVSFQVIGLSVYGMTPSSGPIGAPFTISGAGFGPYAGANTAVTFGGVSAPIAVWNDETISGRVPGAASSGTAVVLIERIEGSAVSSTTAPSFLVVVPVISSITPTSGAAGTGVMISGTGFGPYNGSETNLHVAGSTVALSVWNNQEIVWTVPSTLANGADSVVVSITPPGGSVQSSSVTFTVTGGGEGGSARSAFNIVSAPAATLAAEPDYYFQGDLIFSTGTVASIVTPSGAAVQVPSGVLTKTSELTLQRPPTTALSTPDAALAKQGFSAVGQPVEFGPTGLAFSQPITITLPYDPSLVTSSELGTVAIYYFDPVASEWSALPTQLVAGQYVLTAQTSHFSLYQPLHLGPLVSGGGTYDTFGLRTSYAFPNPSNHGAAVDFRMETGVADSVDLHVYNVAGKRVLSTTINNVSFITDPTMGQQDSYDYVWNVSGVGTGAYSFVFVAHKSGEHDIVATGKIAVIK